MRFKPGDRVRIRQDSTWVIGRGRVGKVFKADISGIYVLSMEDTSIMTDAADEELEAMEEGGIQLPTIEIKPLPKDWLRSDFRDTDFRSACQGYPCAGQCDYALRIIRDNDPWEEEIILRLWHVFPSDDSCQEIILRMSGFEYRKLEGTDIPMELLINAARGAHETRFGPPRKDEPVPVFNVGDRIRYRLKTIDGSGSISSYAGQAGTVRAIASPGYYYIDWDNPALDIKTAFHTLAIEPFDSRFKVGARVIVAGERAAKENPSLLGKQGVITSTRPDVNGQRQWAIRFDDSYETPGLFEYKLNLVVEAPAIGTPPTPTEAQRLAAYLTRKIVPQKRLG